MTTARMIIAAWAALMLMLAIMPDAKPSPIWLDAALYGGAAFAFAVAIMPWGHP